MSKYHDHRDDCPFKFAPLDVCDCVEKNMLDRIAAQAAEIERLRSELATCEKYRDAYAEMERIGTQAVRDLEAKLAMVESVMDASFVEYEAKLENLLGGAETVLEAWDSGDEASFRRGRHRRRPR